MSYATSSRNLSSDQQRFKPLTKEIIIPSFDNWSLSREIQRIRDTSVRHPETGNIIITPTSFTSILLVLDVLAERTNSIPKTTDSSLYDNPSFVEFKKAWGARNISPEHSRIFEERAKVLIQSAGHEDRGV